MINKADGKRVYIVFVLVSALVAVVITSQFLMIYENFMDGYRFPYWLDALLSIALFLAVFYLFEKRLFKNTHPRPLAVVDVPNISGRWVGFLTSSYKREGKNVIVPMSLEIKQNLSSIVVRAYFEKGYSESVMASFERNGEQRYLSYIYDNARPGKSNGIENHDKGAVMLEYFEKDKRMLKGTYFNDLKPQSNHGEISVSYVGSELINEK